MVHCTGTEDSDLLAGGEEAGFHAFLRQRRHAVLHSAFVVSLAIMVGAIEGFSTAAFAIAVILASIVMYDASGVRHETGVQGQVLNEILEKVFVNGEPITDVELKELVGHTKVEVAGGFIVGVLTALGFIYL